MTFEKHSGFHPDFESLVVELRGSPATVEAVKNVIIDFMKKQVEWTNC